MERVGVKELQARLSFYLKNLPIEVTSKGKVVACLISSKDGIYLSQKAGVSATKPLNNATLEVYTKPGVVERIKCQKCGKLYCLDEIKEGHLDPMGDGWRIVCLYCLRIKERVINEGFKVSGELEKW